MRIPACEPPNCPPVTPPCAVRPARVTAHALADQRDGRRGVATGVEDGCAANGGTPGSGAMRGGAAPRGTDCAASIARRVTGRRESRAGVSGRGKATGRMVLTGARTDTVSARTAARTGAVSRRIGPIGTVPSGHSSAVRTAIQPTPTAARNRNGRPRPDRCTSIKGRGRGDACRADSERHGMSCPTAARPPEASEHTPIPRGVRRAAR